MTMDFSPATITRVEKAAVDNGFDQELLRERDRLSFASTQCPLRNWLTSAGGTAVHAAFSQLNVARALDQYGMPMAAPFPKGAFGGWTVSDIPSLHHLLRRAFQFSKTLPDELLHSFEKQIATLPRTTEIERLVVQRVGQDKFRRGLLDYWEGRCAITGLAVPEMLRASHIKPRADCDSDAERLDVFNGFCSHQTSMPPLIGASSPSPTKTVIVSGMLDVAARHTLGLDAALRVRTRLLHDAHRNYMPWHRERVFQH